MSNIGIFINSAVLVRLIVLSWKLPRTFGLFGLLGCHLLVLIAWVCMGCIALKTGVWGSYEGIEVFGTFIQAFIFNCLMLPLSIPAMLRWRTYSKLCPEFQEEEE